MWKTLRVCEKLSRQLKTASQFNRTFLSNSYSCEEAWNKRLKSPLLENVNLETLYLTLNQKYNQDGKAHAVDIDIFANAIVEGNQEIDELLELLHKLRMTNETSNTLESTHHAVIRCFLKSGRTEDLLTVLHDRLNYGIFPDNFALNILIDSLIKSKDYASAARVGVLLMLQEDTENPISNLLAIYSCHMYLKNPDDWKEPEPVVDDSKEEIKVRVKYLRNPYFDDHFDLKKPAHLVGKTLSLYGRNLGDSPLGRTYELIGLTLYGKYEKAKSLIKEWTRKNVKQVLYQDGLEFIKNELSKIPETEVNEDVKALVAELKMLENADLVKDNLDEAIENKVKEVVSQRTEEDITSQCQAFVEWESERQAVLDVQIAELDRQSRLAKVAEIKKDLEERERVLTFFENEEQIDLTIDSKKVIYKKKWFGKKKKPRAIDENYIPPEVNSQRSS